MTDLKALAVAAREATERQKSKIVSCALPTAGMRRDAEIIADFDDAATPSAIIALCEEVERLAKALKAADDFLTTEGHSPDLDPCPACEVLREIRNP